MTDLMFGAVAFLLLYTVIEGSIKFKSRFKLLYSSLLLLCWSVRLTLVRAQNIRCERTHDRLIQLPISVSKNRV